MTLNITVILPLKIKDCPSGMHAAKKSRHTAERVSFDKSHRVRFLPSDRKIILEKTSRDVGLDP